MCGDPLDTCYFGHTQPTFKIMSGACVNKCRTPLQLHARSLETTRERARAERRGKERRVARDNRAQHPHVHLSPSLCARTQCTDGALRLERRGISRREKSTNRFCCPVVLEEGNKHVGGTETQGCDSLRMEWTDEAGIPSWHASER